MSPPVNPGIAGLVWSLIGLRLALPLACSPSPRQSASAADPAVRAALLSELRRQAQRSIYPVTVHDSTVHFSDVPSIVVPGLVLHWATYHAPELSHGYFSALVGSRAGRVESIHDRADWGLLALGWHPAARDDVERACLELVRITKASPFHPPILLRDLRPDNPALVDGDWSNLQHRSQDTTIVHAPGEGGYSEWRASLWVFDPSLSILAVRYECELPGPNEGPGAIQLSRIDSVPRPSRGKEPPEQAPLLKLLPN